MKETEENKSDDSGFNSEDVVESFVKYLPLISLAVYTLGYFRSKWYYDYFNVNIQYYSDISEFIFPAILILAGYLSFLIFNFFFVYVIFSFKKLTIIVSVLVILLGRFFVPMTTTLIYYTASSVSIFLFMIYVDRKKIEGVRFIATVIVLFIVHSIIVFIFSKVDAKQILTEKPSLNIEFKKGSKSFSTLTGSYRFIGETKSHIFLFNTKKRKTEVYLKENLEDLKFYKLKVASGSKDTSNDVTWLDLLL